MHPAFGEVLSPRPLQWVWGERQTQKVSSPAAGAQWSWKPSADRLWRPLAIAAKLQTSAQVATRHAKLEWFDGKGNLIAFTESGVEHVANNTVVYGWWPGAFTSLTALHPRSIAAAPDLLLTDEMSIESGVEAMQTEDQWSAIVIYAETFWRVPANTTGHG